MSITNNPPNSPDGTIPVTEAIMMMANWEIFLATSKPDFIARSFLAPIISFKNLLKYNPDAEAIRIYIGLENESDPLSAKLMFIPIVNGEEVRTLNAAELTEGEGEVEGDGSNVYDLTSACPPKC